MTTTESDTITKQFILYTNKPNFLLVDFGNDYVWSFPAFNWVTMTPHLSNGNLLYFEQGEVKLALNWRLNTNPNSAQGTLFPATSRKGFMDAVCDFIEHS